MLNRILIGAGAAALAVAGILWYGAHREGVGYDRRDMQAKIELGQRQTALYETQEKLDRALYAVDQTNQLRKTETAALRGDLGVVSKRLRQLTARDGIRPGQSPEDPGGAYAAGPDWIGAFAACYAEYESLGNDVAGPLDDLRGLQDAVRVIQ